MGSSSADGQVDAQHTAAGIQSATAINVGQSQADAALQAAQITSDTALQVAEMQIAGSVQAAGIAAGGTAHAANVAAGATTHAANLIDARAREAVERSEAAGALAIADQQPMAQFANQDALDDLQSASTLEGFADRLGTIQDSDVYADLRDERLQDASAYASSMGLSRSGAAVQEAARIGTREAMGIEGLTYGRQLTNVGIGIDAINNIGNIRTASAAGQGANLVRAGMAQGQIIANGGANQANILANGANVQAGYIQQGANYGANAVQVGGMAHANALQQSAYYLGQGHMGAANAEAAGLIGGANAQAQARQNRNNLIAGVAGSALGAAGQIGSAAIFYSDERLKENMQPVGEIDGLTLYEWDWKPEARDLLGAEMSIGFSAQEVERKYPDCVSDKEGLKMIDYERLTEKLRLAA